MIVERLPIGCVILAAGGSSRFGSNKLLAEFRGKTLIWRALEAVPAGVPAAVVTGCGAVEELAEAFGFLCVRNTRPELGISRSVALGTAALAERCGGLVFLVADQPLLRPQTVERLIAAFRAEPDRIVVPVAGDRRGNPCVFPAELFPALQSLEGDRGGAQLIRAHPERVTAVEVPVRELLDADTVEALAALDAQAP